MIKYILWFTLAFTLNPTYTHAAGQSYNFQYLNGVMGVNQAVTMSAWNGFSLPKYYSMSVSGTAATFQVNLEGSLDSRAWTTIAITNSALGMISNTSPIPAIYFRMRATAIASNGGNITGTAVGVF